jgi:hypothetical protein
MRVDVLRTFRAAADKNGSTEITIKEGKNVELPEHLADAAEGLAKDGYIKILAGGNPKPMA